MKLQCFVYKAGRQYSSKASNELIVAETGSHVKLNTNQGGFDFADFPKDGIQALHMRNIVKRAKI